jgi:hypothetical protein
MPFSRQIRSNIASPPPRLNRAVNCLALSLRISSGTPYWRSAATRARQMARPVAFGTTAARTQNRGVVVDTGDHLGLGAAGQPNPADDVRWPQFHRPVAFPPPVVLPLATAGHGIDQARAGRGSGAP